MQDADAQALVARLIHGWERRDADAVAACFAVDGVWHNMPFAPIRGRTAIVASLQRFLASVDAVRFIIRHQAVIAPGIVVTERNDVFTMPGGTIIDLPVMGIFEVSDNHIAVWRDYFDPAAMPGG